MAEHEIRRGCYWLETAPDAPRHSPLDDDIDCDAAVVGGGIVGITAARLLVDAGLRVVLLEAGRLGEQATGRSTAKLTSQHGLIYGDLARNHGDETARLYGEANQAAVAAVASMVEKRGIDCDFRRGDAYVYSRGEDDRQALEEEAATAASLGLPADFVEQVELPFKVAGAVRFRDQACFHPVRYLRGLAATLADDGCRLFEDTRVTAVESGARMRLRTAAGAVTADNVVVATHMPFLTKGAFFAKAYPKAHPMAAVPAPGDAAPDGMYLERGSGAYSFRTAAGPDGTHLVAVGRPFRPGHAADAQAAFADLEDFLQRQLGTAQVAFRWTNEDFDSMDGLPLVGRATSGQQHLFVATGFSAWGISNGVAAAMVIADEILQRPNPWASMLDAARRDVGKAGGRFVRENLHVARHMISDHLRRRPRDVQELPAGEAGVFTHGGERLAVYRDEDSQLHAVSAICTHMKCIVGWNPVDRTWDCPCHGSRFGIDGSVVYGPAVAPLTRRTID